MVSEFTKEDPIALSANIKIGAIAVLDVWGFRYFVRDKGSSKEIAITILCEL